MGEAWIYTPSSRQEYRNGYDAKIVGQGAFREIVLQFKCPKPSYDQFSIRVTRHQHEVLRKLYPPGVAYYVTAAFRNVREVQAAQRQAKSAAEFLRHYVAIEISEHLPVDAQRLYFERGAEPWKIRTVGYKREAEGKARKASQRVPKTTGWGSGYSLINKVREKAIGTIVDPFGSGANSEREPGIGAGDTRP
jgi:hypothetical protein